MIQTSFGWANKGSGPCRAREGLTGAAWDGDTRCGPDHQLPTRIPCHLLVATPALEPANPHLASPVLWVRRTVKWARALDGSEYMPGLVGLNNMKVWLGWDWSEIVVRIKLSCSLLCVIL